MFKLIERFNRNIFLNERSTIQQLFCCPPESRQILSHKINHNIDHIKTFKGLTIVFDNTWLKLDKPEIIQKRLQEKFDFKAMYGFNSNTELFPKFLVNVAQYKLWNEEFDKWLHEHIFQNNIRFNYVTCQLLKKIIKEHGINQETVALDEQLERLKR